MPFIPFSKFSIQGQIKLTDGLDKGTHYFVYMLLDVHISICITTALKFYMKVLFFLITHISEITQGNLPIKTRSVTGELSCPMTALVYFYSAFKFHCIVSSFVWEFGQHLSW